MSGEADWTIVTGASSGIGTEIARGFAERGSSIVLVARRAERLEALRREIEAQHGVEVRVLALDLETADAPDRLLADLDAAGIRPHRLVNNAGFGLRGGFTTLPEAEQAAMVQLNVLALARLCRLVAPGMVERRRGGIINVASTAAFQAIPFFATYAATKAFVLSFSEALHEELRPSGVVVTALCPGPTATEFAARADMEKSNVFKHAMSARDVARLGIGGHLAGRAIVVTGGLNRFGTVVTRFVPRIVVRRTAAMLQR